jgi:hypothetical protein
LIVFDKQQNKMNYTNEKLRMELENSLYNFNFQTIDFINSIEELYYGIDWLNENMKEI